MSQGIMGKWTQLERHLDRRGKCKVRRKRHFVGNQIRNAT
jgi:hypothetical protein